MPVACHQNIVFNSYAAPIRQVDTGFHRHHHARLERPILMGSQPRRLVDLQAEAMA